MYEDIILDRRVPKDWNHVNKYPLRLTNSTAIESFEKILPIPRLYRERYDQGTEGACVGYSLSWSMSILNRRLYDAFKLYQAAQAIDEWPETPPEGGTSVRAGFDVLRTVGHWRVYAGEARNVELVEGIEANRWIRSVDEVRSMIQLGTPVNLGINWYAGFFEPEALPRHDRAAQFGYKDHWLGKNTSWGRVSGGHAIALVGVSDAREAFALCNTWGKNWPFIVWLPYAAFERLMREDGEAGVVVDR